MSVYKFAKEVFLVTPYYDDFKNMDTFDQIGVIALMEKVCHQFMSLGFKDFTIIGDDSLSIDLYKFFETRDARIKVICLHPEVSQEFLLNNFVAKGRDELLRKGLFLPIDSLGDEAIKSYTKIRTHLTGEVDFMKKDQDKKLEIIKRVRMFETMGLSLVEENLFKQDGMMSMYLQIVGKTQEEEDADILANLTSEWIRTCERLADNGLEEEHTKQVEDQLNDYMSLISNQQAHVNEKTESILVSINEEELSSLNENNESEGISDNVKFMEKLDLTKNLQGSNFKEYANYNSIVEELTEVTDLVTKYCKLSMAHLVKEHSLFVDFQLSATSDRSKSLPYSNMDKNAIILNVNLRTGLAESFFKGGPYKLQPFFDNNSNVRPNVTEW